MMHFTFLLSMHTYHPFVYSIRTNAQQSAVCSTEDPTTYKLSMSMTFKIPPWYLLFLHQPFQFPDDSCQSFKQTLKFLCRFLSK